MEIYRLSRKSRALGTGIPRCVANSGAYSLNPVRGCLMACSYCAYRALPSSPGDDELYIYVDLAAQLSEELDRMDRSGRSPALVLLNTGADCFMGLSEVDRIVLDCLEILFSRRIPVQITTKGVLPRELLPLLEKNRERVRVSSSLPSLSTDFFKRFEPKAPGIDARLAMLDTLNRAGIDTRIKVEPLIPAENDSEGELKELLRALYHVGVRRFSAAYLQLRPGVERRLLARLGPLSTGLITNWYRSAVPGTRPDLGDETVRFETLPPQKHRLDTYRLLGKIAGTLGMSMNICSCRNPDIGGGACYHVPDAPTSGLKPKRQLDLF